MAPRREYKRRDLTRLIKYWAYIYGEGAKSRADAEVLKFNSLRDIQDHISLNPVKDSLMIIRCPITDGIVYRKERGTNKVVKL